MTNGARSVVGAGTACAVMASIAVWSAPASYSQTAEKSPNEIGGVGHIVAAGGTISITGPDGAVVRSVLVRRGQRVKRGDMLMTLDDDSATAEEELAQQRLATQQKLDAERQAGEAVAAALAADRLRRAEHDLAAYAALGANATTEREASRLQGNVAEARFAQDIETSKQRQVHIEAELAQVEDAERLKTAKIASEQFHLRAPIDGIILAVGHLAGERLGGVPAVQIADLGVMSVDCQVYEGDILNISPGMKATIKNAAFEKPLTGTVDSVARTIDTQARLGALTIRLDEPEPADRVVGMEVEVRIAR
jgi:multidrug resistance efflux pump